MSKTRKESQPLVFEPRHEKICICGFRPGPTQTGLYNHMATDFEFRIKGVKALYYLFCENKGGNAKSRVSHDAVYLMSTWLTKIIVFRQFLGGSR